MSHADELSPAYQRPMDAASVPTIRPEGPDWAVVLVIFAIGSTVAWIGLLAWASWRLAQTLLT